MDTRRRVCLSRSAAIDDYVIDIDKIIEKNIISKLEHIMYGLGVSNSILSVMLA